MGEENGDTHPGQKHQIVMQGHLLDDKNARDEAEGHEDGGDDEEDDGDDEDLGPLVFHGG